MAKSKSPNVTAASDGDVPFAVNSVSPARAEIKVSPAAPPSAGYEFDAQQNTQLTQLAAAMGVVGVGLLLLGLVCVIGAVLQLLVGSRSFVAMLVQGLLLIPMGLWTRGAAVHFLRIVRTQGSDVPVLMEAVQQLTKTYTLQKWLVLLVLALLVLATVYSQLGARLL